MQTDYQAPTQAPSNHVAPPERAPERPIVIQLQDHKGSGGGPRADKRIAWVALSDDPDSEYAGHQIKVRVRYPEAINVEYFGSGSPGSIRDGLRQVVIEHNGWQDPDSDSDPPAVLPPCDQRCTLEATTTEALKAEDVTYAVALKEARTDASRAAAEAAHTKAVEHIHADAKRRRMEQTEPCCFWDAVSAEEVILMARALNKARGKVLTFLLETKPS